MKVSLILTKFSRKIEIKLFPLCAILHESTLLGNCFSDILNKIEIWYKKISSLFRTFFTKIKNILAYISLVLKILVVNKHIKRKKNTDSQFHNIFTVFDVFRNLFFTTSETTTDCSL